MTKEEFINQLPDLEDYQRIYEYMLPQQGGTIQFGEDKYDYEEACMEEFFNEKNNN